MNGITTIIAWIILEILSGMVDYTFFFFFFFFFFYGRSFNKSQHVNNWRNLPYRSSEIDNSCSSLFMYITCELSLKQLAPIVLICLLVCAVAG